MQPVNPPPQNKETSGNAKARTRLWKPSFASQRARQVELAWSRSINEGGAWYRKDAFIMQIIDSNLFNCR